MSSYHVGLMSGTSLDAADAALVEFATGVAPRLHATYALPPPADLRHELLQLARHDAALPLKRLGTLDQRLGDWFAEAALAVMAAADVAATDIAAIGSHGQTVRHEPDAALPFSLQLGSASRIAARTGCTVVADFRSADLAVGGQGAPLVPAFHNHLFAHPTQARVVVNIGGIANLTVLPAGTDRRGPGVTGLDSGPGNALLDAWTMQHLGQAMDAGGQWAARGSVHVRLLQRMLTEPYLRRSPPRSTGREYFNIDWLRGHLAQVACAIEAVDVQATLCEYTARTIAQAIERFGPGNEEILICGGGAHNRHLLERLAHQLAPRTVVTTAAHGLNPDWVEAMAFAWLAQRRLAGQSGNLPAVTGARTSAVLGAVHAPPDN